MEINYNNVLKKKRLTKLNSKINTEDDDEYLDLPF